MTVKSFEFSANLNKQFENVIATNNENLGENNFHAIPIDQIIIENNPRKLTLSRDDILNGIKKDDPDYKRKEKERYEIENGLALSIKEKGLLQPIHVYKNHNNFVLIVGQRRTLASLIIGKKTILAKVWDKKPDDIDIQTIQWIENFNRKGLTTREAIDCASELAKLHQQKSGKEISVSQMANYLYCSKSQAVKYHALMNAKPDIEQAIRNGKIKSLKKAYELNKIKDDTYRQSLIASVEGKKITQNEIENISNTLKKEKKSSSSKIKNNLGRRAEKVTLGSTAKTSIVKEIIEAVLERPLFRDIGIKLELPDWKDFKSVNKAFKEFIGIMERVVSEK